MINASSVAKSRPCRPVRDVEEGLKFVEGNDDEVRGHRERLFTFWEARAEALSSSVLVCVPQAVGTVAVVFGPRLLDLRAGKKEERGEKTIRGKEKKGAGEGGRARRRGREGMED